MIANRREFLIAGTAALLGGRMLRAEERARSTMGIVSHSYTIRNAMARARGNVGEIDASEFVKLCAERGAGGVQLDLGDPSDEDVKNLRTNLVEHDMYLELSATLPRNRTQVDDFNDKLFQLARSDQLSQFVIRTALLSGRRYEVFATASEFRAFKNQAYKSLSLVKPLLDNWRRNNSWRFKLAIENHKDFRTPELIELLERLDSPQIGVCIDTGNNLALLEDPMETIEALAPWAFSTHLKDMAVERYADGFLLSEVPLGQGFLDLPRIVRTLRRARPEINFNLEMITRDPLKIPYRTSKYWETMKDAPAQSVAHALDTVRDHLAKTPLPRVSNLSQEEKLKREDDNVRESLRYAREHLGMSA